MASTAVVALDLVAPATRADMALDRRLAAGFQPLLQRNVLRAHVGVADMQPAAAGFVERFQVGGAFAAGVAANDARVKALVASLEGVDINEAIEKAAVAPVAVAAAPATGAAPAAAAAEEEPEKDEKEEEESGMAGLGALFG